MGELPLGILSGNPKDEPLHYGEIFSVWGSSMAAKGAISCYGVYLNHAGDHDLKEIINEYIDQAKSEIKELDRVLVDNGITPAPDMAEKPSVKLEDIPVGARFADQEIAAALSVDIAGGLVACSAAMSTCIREDIAAMYAKFHLEKVVLAGKILRMQKEKAWLIPPPLQIKRPENE